MNKENKMHESNHTAMLGHVPCLLKDDAAAPANKARSSANNNMSLELRDVQPPVFVRSSATDGFFKLDVLLLQMRPSRTDEVHKGRSNSQEGIL